MAILAPGENADAILYFGTNNSTTWVPKTAIIAEGNNYWGQSKLHFCLSNTDDDVTTAASISNSRMTILPNGDVGIGTTSPGSRLHLLHDDTNKLGLTLAYGDDNAGSGGWNQIILGYWGDYSTGSTYSHSIRTRHRSSAGGDHQNAIDFYLWKGGGVKTDLGTEHGMSVTAAGVGIGTSSPGSTLHIKAKSDSLYHNNGYKSHSSFALTMERYGTTDTWSFLINGDSANNHNDLNFLYNGYRKGYLDEASNVNQIDFTGQHRNIINNDQENSVGLIVVSTGKYMNLDNDMKPKINESLPICEISNKEKDKKVFGVISDKEDEDRVYHTGAWASVYDKANVNEKRYFINSVGEGAMWVCNTNGDLENGDYITTSHVSGYGQKQDDDLLHNFTVAKITCDCNFSLMKQNQKQIKTIQKERIVDDILKDESGNAILDASGNETIIQKTITEQELVFDNSGNVIIEDKQDLSGNNIEDYPYDIRFLLPDGSIISEEEYLTLKSNNETCYIAYFVGVTYHCG